MRRVFGLSSRGQAPSGSTGQQGSCRGPWPGVRVRAVGKLHKAASAGDVARVQHLLILGKSGVNDRDEKHRTALHFACAYGHPEVVTLLVERKCDIDACDSEKSTALIKAVQCHQEECVTILLEHGANPNVADANGNTALHYAVYSENTSIAAKLLSHHAKTEAKNKDDLAPHLLALRENRQQVAELCIKKEANIHMVDKPGRQIFEYEDKRLKNPQNSHPVLGPEPRTSHMLVDESSEDDSLTRFSDKPDPDDSWPTSEEDDFNFDNKNVPKINLTELWAAAQQSRKNQAKYSTGEPGNRTLLDNSISDSENKDVVETLPKTSVNVQSFSQSSFLSPSPEPKEEATRSAIRKEENGTCVIKNDSQEQTNDNLTHVDGGHKNYKSDMMFALGLGEDDESPWDSESVSENLPQKSVDHLSGAADEKGKHTGNRQVEDVIYIPSCISGSKNFKMAKLEDTGNVGKPVAHKESPEKCLHLKPAIEMKDSVPNKAVAVEDLQTCKSEEPEEEQKRLHGCENSQEQVEEKRKQIHNDMEVSENKYSGTVTTADGDNDGLIQQRKTGKTDNQQFPIKENEEHDSSGPALPVREVKKNENEHWSSTESMTSPVFEKANFLSGGLLQVKGGCNFHDTDENERRSTKKISNEKSKVKEQIDGVDDLDDLSQPSETASEDFELLYPKYENILLLFEQLRMECKGRTTAKM